jgi:hypothetical protein
VQCGLIGQQSSMPAIKLELLKDWELSVSTIDHDSLLHTSQSYVHVTTNRYSGIRAKCLLSTPFPHHKTKDHDYNITTAYRTFHSVSPHSKVGSFPHYCRYAPISELKVSRAN